VIGSTEAATLLQLSVVHGDTGRHTEALRVAEEAWTIARDQAGQRLKADVLGTLRTAYQRLRRTAEAIDHFGRALGLARETESRTPEAEALLGLAEVHLDLGLRRLPSRDFEINQAWCVAATIAADLIAWLQILALDGDLAKAEPKRLRYRLLHTAARLTRG
jgi:tetratricopeptide (TPR) repeat protein